MTRSFLLYSNDRSRYLEFTPYDGSIMWAGLQQYAHVLSLEDAERLLAILPEAWRLEIVADYAQREPQPIPFNAQLPKGRRQVA